MIYKFRFEVADDDNKLYHMRSEESGNFWLAFMKFTQYVMKYAETLKEENAPTSR